MGTNYYLHERPACDCCGREYPPLHIGKSSGGWCFSLHVIMEPPLGELGIRSLDDWRERWNLPGAYIKDEYGDTITVEQMEGIITERASPGVRDESFDYARNHAERGPHGLVRHRIGPHCIGHGEGTWDYIPGEFS